MKLFPGPIWGSFEELRVRYATAFRDLKPGEVAVLKSKGSQVRVMTVETYDTLFEQASAVQECMVLMDDLKLSLEVHAAHPSDASLELTVRLASRLSELKGRLGLLEVAP